jgi:replicative DNA helicase
MSALGERTLIQHLIDPESLEVLAREGLAPECVPSEDLRKVYLWAMDIYYRSGLKSAPSEQVIKAEWEIILDQNELDITQDPENGIEWVIDDLKGSYVFHQSQEFNKRFAVAMAEGTTVDKVDVVNQFSTELLQLATTVENRESKVDVREAMAGRIAAYEERSQNQGQAHGMKLGIPEIDEYTGGIHPGELAFIAAGPKLGKSWYMAWAAWKEWDKAERSVTFFTLENSVEMTLDRIACLACGVNSTAWQRGTCDEESVDRVKAWHEEVLGRQNLPPLHIIQPEPGMRTVEVMVRTAQLHEADSLLIDQLSYIEAPDLRQPRHLQIRDILHTLKAMISTGRHRMPCLLAHQISREGVKAALKANRLEMFHLAEGSEAERTADWVFGLHQTPAWSNDQAGFQTMASRRAPNESFKLLWKVGAGEIGYVGPWEIQEELERT